MNFKDFKLKEVCNLGDSVFCDGCNGPYGDEVNGGVIIGGYAYCGECCKRYGYDKDEYEYADEIEEIMDKGKTFKENVLDYRKRKTGSSDGIMQIFTVD